MKYFIDTEFVEGKQKKLFGYTKPTIDLISIGIVREDGREYYAISKDFNLKEAWNRYEIKKNTNDYYVPLSECKEYWIRDNVLKPIFREWYAVHNNIDPTVFDHKFTYKEFKRLLNKYGKCNKEIADDIMGFCKQPPKKELTIDRKFYCTDELYENAKNKLANGESVKLTEVTYDKPDKPEFYGYYSDYDWVVFCWLFGKMIDLPNGFPHYCKDLQQIFETKKNTTKGRLKDLPGFPINNNNHNALSDARWNHQLYNFLKKLCSY